MQQIIKTLFSEKKIYMETFYRTWAREAPRIKTSIRSGCTNQYLPVRTDSRHVNWTMSHNPVWNRAYCPLWLLSLVYCHFLMVKHEGTSSKRFFSSFLSFLSCSLSLPLPPSRLTPRCVVTTITASSSPLVLHHLLSFLFLFLLPYPPLSPPPFPPLLSTFSWFEPRIIISYNSSIPVRDRISTIWVHTSVLSAQNTCVYQFQKNKILEI